MVMGNSARKKKVVKVSVSDQCIKAFLADPPTLDFLELPDLLEAPECEEDFNLRASLSRMKASLRMAYDQGIISSISTM